MPPTGRKKREVEDGEVGNKVIASIKPIKNRGIRKGLRGIDIMGASDDSPSAYTASRRPIEKKSAAEGSLAKATKFESSSAGDDGDDYVDPLDAFMDNLRSNNSPESLRRDINGGKIGNKRKAALNSSAAVSSGADSETDGEDDVYNMFVNQPQDSKINPFGSNFVTADDLDKLSASGWESDAPSEGEEEKDKKAERERKEFMEAFKSSIGQGNNELGKDGNGKSSKKSQDLGVLYAEEGDVMDAEMLDATKKSALQLLEEKKKSKELKQIDHSKMNYLPFRKNLYIVPRLLSQLSEDEVKEKREDLDVKVRGRGCPAPVTSWEQCGLSERVLQVIQKHGLKAPYAIQKQAVPAIMCGRDVIGVAATGSGKTLAFLLPMFRHILDQPPLSISDGPIGLIMAPARELAFQIHSEAKKFCKSLGLQVACLYGGAGVAEQIADLKRGAHIVVCTPGRMIDVLCMQSGKLLSLARVSMVVMDEADRMFDMGFEPQIKMITQNVRPDRQTILFSATFPKQIEKLAKSVLKFPLEIMVGERSSVNKDITQIVEVHEDHNKFLRLLQLLGLWYEKGNVLIFVDKQDKCDQLYQDLTKSGYPCLSLHGGKDQEDRDHTLHEFKTLIKTVMIATGVAGRGLDVPEIVCVVNYNCPNHLEDYVHRVGRTGRAGRKGTAYTFLGPSEEQYSPIMIKVLEKVGNPPPKSLIKMCDDFKNKVKAGKAKWSSSGFEGKGYTFDPDEMSEAQKTKALQKSALLKEQGIEDSTDSAGLMGEGDDDEGLGADASLSQEEDLGSGVTTNNIPFEHAKRTLLEIFKTKVIVPGQFSTGKNNLFFSSPLVNKDGSLDAEAALMRAHYVAAKYRVARVVQERASAGGGKRNAKGHYQEILDINDYPPLARRKVTMKNGLDRVIESTGVAIVGRGSYIAPGKKPEPGQERLHFILEAAEEIQVKQARAEIIRLLDEEVVKITGTATTGRYTIS